MLFRLLIFLLILYFAWQFVRRIMVASSSLRGQATQRPLVQDLTECPVCSSFVAPSAGRCERPDCPRRG